jgi:1-acyl-sn-glycerol-3-phosphate acyltransferase
MSTQAIAVTDSLPKHALWRLNYLWRLLATGYCFTFFFGFGFILALTLLPLVRLTCRDPQEKNRRARRLVNRIWRFFVWQMRVLGILSLKVEGMDYLKQSPGQLVIANHPTLIDVVLLVSLMPNTCCVVKEELRHNRFLKGVVKAMGYITNASADELLGGSQREFDAGGAVMVFPEGTRTENHDSTLKFQRGAANIAARCGVDIVPVFINCEPPSLRKGEQWYQIPDRKMCFTLRVQPPLRLSELNIDYSSQAKASRELNRFLEAYFNESLMRV